MKILFVLENYYPNIGGVETLFKILIERLVAANHECTVVTSQLHPDDPLDESLPGLRIIRIPVSNRYLFTLQALRPVWRHIGTCDLVQTTSYNAALPAFLIAFLRRKKIVVTFHEAWGKLWFRLPFMGRIGKIAHYLFEQLLLKLPFDRFVAVSHSTARRLLEEGVSEKRIETIYNGIDYQEFERPELPSENEPKFTFTYFGRLGISKGLDLLIEAAAQIRQSLPDSRLQLIVPQEPAEFLDWLQGAIQQNGLEDYVVLRHHLSFHDLKKAIVQSDCVVIPSYSEGFCFAAVETVALGTPIISSGQAALPEVVGGKYIEMESLSVDDLAKAMTAAYRGAWQEKTLVRFELETTVEAYLELYRSLT
ncbi:glycosyltransferase family 4 protein [Flavilitoribacter nigricans]|uniref:Glycosyltransferase family 1 protein n=1 Tax=Flavilitoribacter nigricans (strain ATCC 23147 / DSM 23189 / NBRC 102662 / NCIMB 1420 / SS-2) TaxID=1122177 RepID=A0A2D0NDK6_FLAN2|nr:glycosyltransferase family 4 protein [Flavilitoribacter nigricans]PHN06456.1 hypothetical protein CRP01_12880 [Flavilitoribacter nigricans DSM 23189 = NBRC 102662]